MTAAIGFYNVILTAIILGGIIGAVGLVCLTFFLSERESRDRSLMPWGPRARVEKARAAAEIAELETKREAADIMRLSLEPRRQIVMQAIEKGEALPEDLPQLDAGSKNGDAMREFSYRA